MNSLSNDVIHVHVVSSTAGSIGEITYDLLPALHKNFFVTEDYYGDTPEKRDVLFMHFLNESVMKQTESFNSFKKKILIQPVDGTVLTRDAVEMINRFDGVITPAYAGKNIMLNNGVNTPIYVIPNFYKPDMLKKEVYSDVEKHIPSDKIIFYHESTFHPRKGIELLYEGFIRAFSNMFWHDQVALVLKDIPFNARTFMQNEKWKKQAIKLQRSLKYSPQIIKYSTFLDDTELKALWGRADVYVSLAKLEGFGIPMLRMHLLNKPIICLRNENSGYMDYLNDTNAYLIDSFPIKAEEEFMWLYEDKTEWNVPLMSDVIETFEKVARDIKVDKQKRLRRETPEHVDMVYKKYSLEQVANQYVSIIKDIWFE